MSDLADEGDVDPWASRFPDLFAEEYVEYADCRIRYTTGAAPEHLVSRLHVVGVTAQGEVVVCRSAEGWRFLPGGTREAGESLSGLAQRELLEEAGASVTGTLRHFAAHAADSNRERPYRPHLPHPRAYWAYAVAPVRIEQVPTNPEGGERVVEVLAMPPGAAADYLAQEDRIHADVVRHAAALGLLTPPAE